MLGHKVSLKIVHREIGVICFGKRINVRAYWTCHFADSVTVRRFDDDIFFGNDITNLKTVRVTLTVQSKTQKSKISLTFLA